MPPSIRRRIAVYVERDLPDLAERRERIAEALGNDLWPMVSGWLSYAERRGALLDWLDERIEQDCSQDSTAIRELKIARTGADNGALRDCGHP
jgi:hypothetical protein